MLEAATHAPGDCGRERFIIDPDGGDWTSVMVVGYGSVEQWGQALSLERSTTVVTFFVLEGCWSYEIFHQGRHVFGMGFFPLPRPILRGDAAEAASLLGCDPAIFERYYRAILAALSGEDEAPDAAPAPR